MLTLLVACLLIYKLDLPQWLYLVAMAVWAVEVGVWRFTLRSEDREFVFLENKLTESRGGLANCAQRQAARDEDLRETA